MIFVIALTLFPLALYCFILAAVNRCRHPVVVSGTWDFLGTVFGASGFLLFAGPYILNNLNERWREQWLLAAADPSAELGDAGHELWWWIRAGYFILVVAGVACLLYRRRRTLSVYNVHPDAVPEVIGQVLDGRAVGWVKRGDAFLLLDRAPVLANSNGDQAALVGGRSAIMAVAPSALATSAHSVQATPLLELDCFRSLHHVSIRWAAEPGPQQPAIEQELRRALAEVNTCDNPAAGWFMVFAGGLFAILVLLLSLWIGLVLFYGVRPL